MQKLSFQISSLVTDDRVTGLQVEHYRVWPAEFTCGQMLLRQIRTAAIIGLKWR
jgi:hypothetical protein